jgi:hypothetical protein
VVRCEPSAERRPRAHTAPQQARAMVRRLLERWHVLLDTAGATSPDHRRLLIRSDWQPCRRRLVTRSANVSPALVVGLGLAGCSTLLLYGDAPGFGATDCGVPELERSEAPKHSFH